MAFLLDTDVISGSRRSDKMNPKLKQWLLSLSANEVFLSAMTIGEIERGIAKQRLVDPDFAADLQDWLQQLLIHHSGRILPVTTEIARRWGTLSQQVGNTNVDILIAATALEHGLTVATRNVKHFHGTGVSVFEPFA